MIILEKIKNNKQNEEPTFLSVWQEQRRIELNKRAATEAEEQKKLVEEAIEELKQFNLTRERKIETIKKDNREKEKLLREDLQATFKHGTIWEQIGKMVNLQEVNNNDNDLNSTDRMRTLLIQLKNNSRQSHRIRNRKYKLFVSIDRVNTHALLIFSEIEKLF